MRLTNMLPITGGRYIFLAGIAISSFTQAYEPPIGIPAPPFGIDETHNMYAGRTYAAGGFAYRDAGNGPYTHYVDNSDPNCTNNNNTYGTADEPRCGMPGGPFPEGTVVEIHGGQNNAYSQNGNVQLVVEGTLENPVFIRGYSSQVENFPQFVNTDFRLSGQYGVFENLDIYDDCNFNVSRTYGTGVSNHISIRNNEIHEPPGDSDDQNGSSAGGEYIVYYKNHVYDNWRSATTDAHGLYVSSGSRYMWILENNIHGNSGNGFQACHGCDTSPPEYIYIGKNEIHGDKELAIGMKYANHVIMSQNHIYDYHENSTSQGTGIVVGADGPTNNVWMIFNEIHNAPYGIRIEETNTNVFLVGNVMYDIERAAINLEKRGRDTYIVNNTIYDVGQYINQTWTPNFVAYIVNNIFANATGNPAIEFETQSVAADSYMANNIFYQDGGSVQIKWGSSNGTYDTSSELSNFRGGDGNLIGDPEFMDSVGHNLHITSQSSAIDVGGTNVDSDFVYDTFKDTYGRNIKVDFEGNTRPVASGWDMGAYEFGASGLKSPPLTPLIQVQQVAN